MMKLTRYVKIIKTKFVYCELKDRVQNSTAIILHRPACMGAVMNTEKDVACCLFLFLLFIMRLVEGRDVRRPEAVFRTL